MTARDAVAYNLGRDAAHKERLQWPSQAGRSEVLGARLRRARVERWLTSVFSDGAAAREGGMQG